MGRRRIFPEHDWQRLTEAGHPPQVGTSRVFSARRNRCPAWLEFAGDSSGAYSSSP